MFPSNQLSGTIPEENIQLNICINNLNNEINDEITSEEIVSCVKNLKNDKANGDDFIVNEYIKRCYTCR
jgi:uncharacterized protein YeeX (DUF496 family)